LVSAKKENGAVVNVNVKSEKGGTLILKNPFGTNGFKCSVDYKINDKGEIVITTNTRDAIKLATIFQIPK